VGVGVVLARETSVGNADLVTRSCSGDPKAFVVIDDALTLATRDRGGISTVNRRRLGSIAAVSRRLSLRLLLPQGMNGRLRHPE